MQTNLLETAQVGDLARGLRPFLTPQSPGQLIPVVLTSSPKQLWVVPRCILSALLSEHFALSPSSQFKSLLGIRMKGAQ